MASQDYYTKESSANGPASDEEAKADTNHHSSSAQMSERVRACAELQSWPASQPATDCAELWRVVEGGGGNLAALTLAGWLAGWV